MGFDFTSRLGNQAMANKHKPRQPIERHFIGMPAKITAILEKESDRGTILVLATYLEAVLGLIVRAACVTDEDADKILEFRAPAGGFDLKIQLCKAFALIHPIEVKGLQAVRGIRNRAAHFDENHGFDVLFDSDSTIDHVANLAKSQNLEMESRDPTAVRDLFVICVRLLATKLYTRLLEVRRPRPLATFKEIANEIRTRMKDTETGKAIAAIEAEAITGNPEKLIAFFKATGEALAELMAKSKERERGNRQA